MNNRTKLSPWCVDAKYAPSRVPHFSGNPLIEALPAALDPDDLLSALMVAPTYSAEHKDLSVAERLQMLKSLSTFMFPMERHFAFTSELDSMLRNGYVGREPSTPEFVRRMQNIYEGRQAGTQDHKAETDDEAPQLSMILMGVSGMGKTRAIKSWAKTLPKVIYHPEHHTYQIPVIHIELPSDGESMTGLCNAVLRAVDKLLPGSDYVEAYATRGRPTVEKLILQVQGVLHRHCVGMLVCDEVQNLTNAGKSKSRLMTELVSMSNILSLPIVFLGTNKAAQLFGLDFRKSRRVSGFGGQHWDRLQESQLLDDGRVVSEWREFVDFMWQFQWTKQDAPITEELRATLYWCCQGVVDTAIKMFAAAQARAILYGTEIVTEDLLMDVYKKDFVLLHPMLEALRKNDLRALAQFEDIYPLGLDVVVDSISRRASALKSPAITTKPGAPNFTAQVATALASTGFSMEISLDAAEEVVSEGNARNLVEAVQMATEKLTPHKPPSRSRTSSKSSKEKAEPDYSDRPNDLRRFIQFASRSGREAMDVMREAGVIKPIEEVLNFG